MMKERGEKKERKYWNDYLKDTRLEDNGEYSYTGAYYDLKGNKAVSKMALIQAAAMMIISAMGGIMPATGAMDTFYVIIPYAATIILSGFSLYYAIKWVHHGGVRLREHDFEKTIPKIKGSSKASFIAAFVTLLAEGIHLMINGMGEHPKGAALLMVCVAITGVIGIFLFRYVNAQEWLKTKEKLD